MSCMVHLVQFHNNLCSKTEYELPVFPIFNFFSNLRKLGNRRRKKNPVDQLMFPIDTISIKS